MTMENNPYWDSEVTQTENEKKALEQELELSKKKFADLVANHFGDEMLNGELDYYHNPKVYKKPFKSKLKKFFNRLRKTF